MFFLISTYITVKKWVFYSAGMSVKLLLVVRRHDGLPVFGRTEPLPQNFTGVWTHQKVEEWHPKRGTAVLHATGRQWVTGVEGVLDRRFVVHVCLLVCRLRHVCGIVTVRVDMEKIPKKKKKRISFLWANQ